MVERYGIISFGPAHPAAHGVFRLIATLSDETVIRSFHSQGLLWRSTEALMESRTLNESSGYFARLDYVAFVVMELGFCPSLSQHQKERYQSLSALNSFGNHVLNLACTLADAGAVGTIL